MVNKDQNCEDANFENLLAFLQETPGKLISLTSDLSDPHIRWKHSNDEFSALENICHLRDLEVQGYAPRIARILAETNPALADFDGARVAAESNYNEEARTVAFEAFEKARHQNVEKLRHLTAEQLERDGMLEGVGRITLRDLAGKMREHDEAHLEDMRVLRQQLKRLEIEQAT